MKEFLKEWWSLGIAILVVIIIGIGIIINMTNNAGENNYRKQAVSILNQYKQGQLTKKEASEKLGNLSEKIANEPDIKDEHKRASIFALQAKLSNLSLQLFNDELSNTQIDNYIKEIK